MTPEERRRKFYEMAKAQEAGLADILPAPKQQRLRQIELQLQGPRAFQDSFAVDALKLTPEQRRQIRDLKDATMIVLFRGPFDKGQPKKEAKDKSSADSGPPAFFKVFKAETESILQILTPEQKARWQELIGQPFHARPRFPHFAIQKAPPSFSPR